MALVKRKVDQFCLLKTSWPSTSPVDWFLIFSKAHHNVFICGRLRVGKNKCLSELGMSPVLEKQTVLCWLLNRHFRMIWGNVFTARNPFSIESKAIVSLAICFAWVSFVVSHFVALRNCVRGSYCFSSPCVSPSSFFPPLVLIMISTNTVQ